MHRQMAAEAREHVRCDTLRLLKAGHAVDSARTEQIGTHYICEFIDEGAQQARNACLQSFAARARRRPCAISHRRSTISSRASMTSC